MYVAVHSCALDSYAPSVSERLLTKNEEQKAKIREHLQKFTPLYGGRRAIDYSQFNPFMWGRTSTDVRLSPAASWAIEIRGGVSHWDSDLRSLELRGIEVRGGVSKVDLRLPRPTGSSIIRVSGGASHLTLRRPAGVPARLQIGGGASKLELDAQYLGAVGGPVRLETPEYANATDRYEVEIGGGASQIRVIRD